MFKKSIGREALYIYWSFITTKPFRKKSLFNKVVNSKSVYILVSDLLVE